MAPRYSYSGYFFKLAAVLIGTSLLAVGSSLLLAIGLGADPIAVFIQGLQRTLEIGLGNAALLCQAFFLLLGLVIGRRYIGPGTVIIALVIGPQVGLFSAWLGSLALEGTTMALRLLLLLPGLGLLTFGIALIISAKFGISSFDIVVLTLNHNTRINLRWLKISLDATFTGGGYLLGADVGVGSLVAVCLIGPLMAFWLPLCRHGLAKVAGRQP